VGVVGECLGTGLDLSLIYLKGTTKNQQSNQLNISFVPARFALGVDSSVAFLTSIFISLQLYVVCRRLRWPADFKTNPRICPPWWVPPGGVRFRCCWRTPTPLCTQWTSLLPQVAVHLVLDRRSYMPLQRALPLVHHAVIVDQIDANISALWITLVKASS
jgi:hypothetical protein